MIPDFRLDPLWLKLNFLNMPGMPGASPMQPFLALLGQQTGWPMPLINAVMEEYRKFLFLAMRAGHPVTPPSMVEQVWMLHLQNAQNYWQTLGQFITERPLAEGVGAKPAATPAEQFRQTLASYERIFGMAPPAEIWGRDPPKADPFKPFTDFFRRMMGLDHQGY